MRERNSFQPQSVGMLSFDRFWEMLQSFDGLRNQVVKLTEGQKHGQTEGRCRPRYNTSHDGRIIRLMQVE